LELLFAHSAKLGIPLLKDSMTMSFVKIQKNIRIDIWMSHTQLFSRCIGTECLFHWAYQAFHPRLRDLERKAAEFDALGGGIEFDSCAVVCYHAGINCLFSCQLPIKRTKAGPETMVYEPKLRIVAA